MSEHLEGPRKKIFKGANQTHLFQLYSGGSVYDLGSVTEITFTVKESDKVSASTIFTCTETGGDVRITDSDTGKIAVDVIPADTSSSTPGDKIYWIKVTDGSSNVVYFGKGIYTIIQT